MPTVKQPYEFLARWDQAGKLVGVHVRWRYIITDDVGKPVAESVGPAEVVSLAGEAGFPMANLLQQLQVDTLQARDAAIAAQKSAETERDAAIAELAKLAKPS